MLPINFIASNSSVSCANVLTRAYGVVVDNIADIFEFACVLGLLEQVTDLVEPEAKRVDTRLDREVGK